MRETRSKRASRVSGGFERVPLRYTREDSNRSLTEGVDQPFQLFGRVRKLSHEVYSPNYRKSAPVAGFRFF